MPITPDEQAQGNVSLQNEVVNPTANGGAGATVRRYTAPVTGDQMNPVAPGTPPATPPVPGAPAAPANPIQGVFNGLPTAYPNATDESTIRDGIAHQMQGQVDAINKYYTDYIGSTIRPEMANNAGATRSTDARSGVLGSDFGNADEANAAQHNDAILGQVQAEREGKLATISNAIDTRAQQEINARKQAAIDNGKAYTDYLQTAQKDARQNVQDLSSIGAVLSPEAKATLMKQTGWDELTFDAYANAHKALGQQAKYNYTNLGNGTILRTGTLANGQAVPEQKFQYDLGPNDEFQVTQNGTPIIVTRNGNAIQNVKIAPGFDTGDLASKYTPVYSNGNVSILNTVTGDQKGFNSSPTSISNNGQPAPQGGFRTDRNSNPTAMTTDVAKTSGLVEGKDYTQGDPFTGKDGQTYYTAKLLGDPVETTIKALDQGGFYTASGQPRWTYLNSLPAADQQAIQNWASASHDQKAQVVKDMYKQEGGSGSLTGDAPASASGKAPDYTDPNGTDALAAKYLQGGDIPKGNGKTSATAGTVIARANEIAQQLGIVQPGEAFDQTALKADQKANMKVLLDQVPQRAQLQSNLDAADSNFNMLTSFMQQHGLNSSDIPLVNQLQQKINSGGLAGADAVGAQSVMNSALAGLATEYSQILARGGQRNETVDKEAAKLIPGNISPKELQDVVNYIKQEGQNVLKSKDTAIANARKSFGNPTSSSSAASSGRTSSGINYSIEP